jgi:tetratricopeptide (TPR) repeat protein
VGNNKLIVSLSLSLLSAQAFAASQQDWDGCQSQIPERVIPACSSIIPDETETPQSRADAYVFRAGAYLAQSNVDRAIADYSEAIKLSPRNVIAYLSRAVARFHKGDRDQAILDYAIAEKLNAAAVAQAATGNPSVSEVEAAERAAPPPASALAFVDRLPAVEAVAPRPAAPPPPVEAATPIPPPMPEVPSKPRAAPKKVAKRQAAPKADEGHTSSPPPLNCQNPMGMLACVNHALTTGQ